MENNKLAILGGEKSVKDSHPHWQWPQTSNEEINAIVKYLKTGKKNKFGYPSVVEEFEFEFAKYHNVKYALTTNSGTSSLHAAFFALGVGEGDEVIAPTLTFHATASPLKQLKALPILCDCEPETGNIDPKDIRKKINKKTKAIIITHLCGHPCEMDEIMDISKRNNIPLIEDCSHAHGSLYKNKRVGTFGQIGCFSMNNQKMLAAGESGVLITNEQEIFEKALLFSDFGPRIENEIKLESNIKYSETGLGNKYRINPISAVIASEKLKKLDNLIKQRNKKLDYLSNGLRYINGISPPITKKYATRGAFNGYRPFLNKDKLNNIDINSFIKALNAEGMEIRQSGNQPLHLLPLFKEPVSVINNFKIPDRYIGNKGKKYFYKKGDMPNSEYFYENTFSLPTFTFESDELLDNYIDAFKKVCNYFEKNKSL